MTIDEARNVLDKVKNGIWQSDSAIKEALFTTGDISKDRTTLCNFGEVSCHVRSRQIYGEKAYERIFGIVQESGTRRGAED